MRMPLAFERKEPTRDVFNTSLRQLELLELAGRTDMLPALRTATSMTPMINERIAVRLCLLERMKSYECML